MNRFPAPAPDSARRAYISDLAQLIHDRLPLHNFRARIPTRVSSYPDEDLVRMRNEERDRIVQAVSRDQWDRADYDPHNQGPHDARALVRTYRHTSPLWNPISEEMTRRKQVKEDRARMGVVAQLASNTNPAGYQIPTDAAASILDFLAAPGATQRSHGRLGYGKVPGKRRQVDYGSYKDGSHILKDKDGYYIVRHLKSQKTDVKRHLKSLANIVEKGAKERKAAKERR